MIYVCMYLWYKQVIAYSSTSIFMFMLSLLYDKQFHRIIPNNKNHALTISVCVYSPSCIFSSSKNADIASPSCVLRTPTMTNSRTRNEFITPNPIKPSNKKIIIEFTACFIRSFQNTIAQQMEIGSRRSATPIRVIFILLTCGRVRTSIL